MLDFLQIGFCRLRPADSIEAALKQLIAPRKVMEARMHVARECDLPEYLAREEQFDLSVLLEETAARLGFAATRELWLPSAALIAQTGHEAEFLASIPALPQPSVSAPAGWLLVIADPLLVDVEEYRQQGVGVVMGLAEDIDAIWAKRRALLRAPLSGGMSDEQLLTVIEQLAADAAKHGAKEVFIGHPSSSNYEFIAEGRRYSGKICAELYQELLKKFDDEMQMNCLVTAPGGRELSLALTKNNDHPVVYLSWNGSCHIESAISEAAETGAGENQIKNAGHNEQTDAGGDAAAPVMSAEKSAAGRQVLLVDDDERFCGILKRILERRGYAVCVQNDGDAALAFIDSAPTPPHLIICDIHMPRSDGTVLLRTLRGRGISIPVMMLTSDENSVTEAEMVQLGADAYLRKQEDLRVLLAWCNNLSGRISDVHVCG